MLRSINPIRMALLLLGASAAITLAIIYVSSPSITIGGEEQNVVFAIQSLVNGAPLYRDPDLPPFVVAQYTPIYYELCFAIAHLEGLQADDLHGIYLLCRLVSAAATVGSVVTLVAILGRTTRLDRISRFAIACLLPTMLGPWAFAARPDTIYLLCVLTALLAALWYAETLRLVPLAVATALLVAGFYTKQTALFLLPLPLLLRAAREGWLAWKLRDMLLLAGVAAIGALGFSSAMAKNFAVGLGNGIDLNGAIHLVYLPVLVRRLPLLLAAGIAYWRAARSTDWRPRALAIATAWYLAVGSSLALKYGSAENYLDEFVAGCLLLAGLTPGLAHDAGEARRPKAALVTLGLLLAAMFAALGLQRQNLQSAMRSRDQLYMDGHAVAADPELRGRFVMTLDSAAFIFLPNRAAFVPLEVLGSSAAAGHFDLRHVTDAVQNGELCFTIVEPALLQKLTTGTSPPGDPDHWAAVIGKILLADFHPTRRIGARVLLVSERCRAPTK